MTCPLARQARLTRRLRAAVAAVSVSLFAAAAGRAEPQPAPDEPADALEIAGLIERYYDALGREDVEAALACWSLDAPDREALERTIRGRARAFDAVYSNVRVSSSRVEGARAVARVSVRREESGLGPLGREATLLRTFDLVRIDEQWSIDAERSTLDDVVDRLAAAGSAAERNAVLEDTPDVPRAEAAEALMRAADRAHIDGLYDTAQRGYEGVLQLLGEGTSALASRALQNLGNIHYVRQEYDRALDSYLSRVRIEEAGSDPSALASALLAVAASQYAASRYDQALDAYERVEALERGLGNRSALALTLSSIGNVRYLQADYDAARVAFTESAALHETLNDPAERARVLYSLGRTYTALGALVRAAAVQEQALAIRNRLDNQAEVAASLAEIARVQFLQGRLTDAEATYTRALDLERQLANADGQGRVALGLGLLRATAARYDDAASTYRDAVSRFESIEGLVGMAYGWLGVGSVMVERGTPAAAIDAYVRALRFFEAESDPVGQSRAHLGLALAQTDRGVRADAVKHAEAASAFARRAAVPDVEWQARFQLGRARWLQGQRQAARAAFEEAVEIIERTGAEQGSRTDELRGVADRTLPLVALVEDAMSTGETERAFMLAEQAKRRAFADLVQEYRSRIVNGMTDDDVREERTLAHARMTAVVLRRREGARADRSPAELAELQQKLDGARAAAARFDASLRERQPDVAWRRGEWSIPTTRQLVNELQPGTAFVEYVVGASAAWAFVAVHPREGGPSREPGLKGFSLATSEREVSRLVDAWSKAIEAGQETERGLAAQLHELVVGPIARNLDDVDALVVVPDGALWWLPWAALGPIDGSRLGARLRLTLVPSAGLALGPRFARPADATQPSSDTLTLSGAVVLNETSPLHTMLPPELEPPVATEGGAETTTTRPGSAVELWELLGRDVLPARVLFRSVRRPASLDRTGGLVGLLGACFASGARAIALQHTAGGADGAAEELATRLAASRSPARALTEALAAAAGSQEHVALGPFASFLLVGWPN